MGDLLSFKGWTNVSHVTPFNWNEYDYEWKLTDRRYLDFTPSNDYNKSCVYPRMWDLDGFPLAESIAKNENGCRASEFDSYGGILGTGAYPVYQNQLSKFASVQDRLREWQPDVLEKIKVMSCNQIRMLDIDGFRMDKGVQITVDAQAEFASYQRDCARQHGKENFIIVGEIVASPQQGSIYVGRGKQPDMVFTNSTEAMMATGNATNDGTSYVREFGQSALDGSAFQYEIYGALTRFLGLSGPFGIRGTDWVDFWNNWLLAGDDMVNVNTGKFDPRQFFGMTNQDVFRWPALSYGTNRQMLGWIVTFLEFPGVPNVFFGEEQESYVLENLANDYVFGRTPMVSQSAWQIHGCYRLGETPYVDMPFNSSGTGCGDPMVSLDHRNPSHPTRNYIKRLFEIREHYPVANEGWVLRRLSERHYDLQLPGSSVNTTYGIWSDYRGRQPVLQDLEPEYGAGANQGLWIVYTNENQTQNHYTFNCSSTVTNDTLLAPFEAGTTVKDLIYPYEELTLRASAFNDFLGLNEGNNGCLPNMTMPFWGFHVFVPKAAWKEPAPVINRIVPHHDMRVEASVPMGETQSVDMEIRFSRAMDCTNLLNNLTLDSTAFGGVQATVNRNSASCANITTDIDPPRNWGEVNSAFSFKFTIDNVGHGVHTFTLNNVSAATGTQFTNAKDTFMFRLGAANNPMVFPWLANYTSGIYHRRDDGALVVAPTAAGADLYRYSTNWGSSYSEWLPYDGKNFTIVPQAWSGTDLQKWTGNHLEMNFWSYKTGSSDHVQHTDLVGEDQTPRRWPHAFVQGNFNQYGFDSGLDGGMSLNQDTGLWEYDLETEWQAADQALPAQVLVNVWGMNPDNLPDKTAAFGDLDGDGVLDWVAPDSLSLNLLNITGLPPSPHIGYRVVANDGNYSYDLLPIGNKYYQLAIGLLLAFIPPLSALIAFWVYWLAFYKVKFNQVGVAPKTRGWFGATKAKLLPSSNGDLRAAVVGMFGGSRQNSTAGPAAPASDALARAGVLEAAAGAPNRRKVLIATMEYKIEDWNIQIKIGGLGVMANLMGANLGHQDLIWVVPCCGGIEYPTDQVAESMFVSMFGEQYEVKVQYHQLRNITFVLLDAPVFRKQTKAEPYPPRMDDLESAVYYSAWNQCIALALDRFKVDMYHINDYHGAAAPLYLLPRTIPCAFSVHNAEFQGLWSIRTPHEREEISKVFHLPVPVIEKYVQFGEIFNLLHAAASYLRVHQKGFGAVGVSNKYGKRSWARYPIFWGLNKVGGLPNPDPSDLAEWDKKLPDEKDIHVNDDYEKERGNLRVQAQEWAGLTTDPTAELFVFVGRWSKQKGVDLIADVFFTVLEENPKAQLICIGPVIDLYGKFAALKLARMMQKYPGRVYSKPEFTQLPPFIFTGAEFALIPSRDEPFGLVAVEFGRKGAIGVGARVGGLGQMPGWWYTIESTATQHQIRQFKMAIRDALASKTETRAMMRARSALQRFPVAQWVEDLEKLQTTAIKYFNRVADRPASMLRGRSGHSTPRLASGASTPYNIWSPAPSLPATAPNSLPASRAASRAPSPERRPAGDVPDVPTPRTYGPGHDSSGRRLSIRRGFMSPSGSRRNSVDDVHAASAAPAVPEIPPQIPPVEMSPSPAKTEKPVRNKSARNLASLAGRLSPAIEEGNENEMTLERIITGQPLQKSDTAKTSGSSERDGSNPAESSATAPDSVELSDAIRSQLPNLVEAEAPPTLATRPKFQHRLSSLRMKRGESASGAPSPTMSPHGSVPGTPSGVRTPAAYDQLLYDPSGRPYAAYPAPPSVLSRASSVLDLNTIRGMDAPADVPKKDYKLEKVDPFFNDPTGLYFRTFEDKLSAVTAKNSENQLCIEEYLERSEKDWFGRYHNAKLGRRASSKIGDEKSSFFRFGGWGSKSETSSSGSDVDDSSSRTDENKEQFLIDADFVAPRGLAKYMMYKIGEWPAYSYLLAFGQILAINSYQITLLTGQVGETANKLYIIACIYLASSIVWWILYRTVKSCWTLALPFFFYGLAFFLLGMGPYADYTGRGWIDNVATGFYAVAASSGSLFFALNFGTDGGAPVKSWVFRACTITGTQQIYVAGLWYWGAKMASVQTAGGNVASETIVSPRLTAVTTPIAVFLWAIAVVLAVGLPAYYRQTPGKVPSFYTSFWRRKIILWFFVYVIIQNYWLSAPYGRNWQYLWTTSYAPAWSIALLVVAFFVFVWAGIMYGFQRLSKEHTWILPIVAIGLGAPRWCQMLWGVSGMAIYVPWGGPTAGALLARCLWLWLGVLDTVQGVGFGMILLQTMTRFYIVFVLFAAQVIGSCFTIAARASAPDATGPGTQFPNLALNLGAGIGQPYLWVSMLFQLVICVGFFLFFRKEQLSKP